MKEIKTNNDMKFKIIRNENKQITGVEKMNEYSVLSSENTESVSNDSSESSDLHDVRKSEGEAKSTTESTESFVGGTLENRIDSENHCSWCNGFGFRIIHTPQGSCKCGCPACNDVGIIAK